MTLNQFVAKYNRKQVDVDRAFGPQCWDLVAAYSRELVGTPIGNPLPTRPGGNGSARDVYEKFIDPLPKYYRRYAYRPGGVPQAGDVAVFSGFLPGSYGHGHVSIVLSANAKSFVSFDQNWGGNYAHKVAHNYGYVLGFLRPVKNIKAAQTKPVPTPKPIYYTVRRGDWLSIIAARFKLSLRQILRLNPRIKNPNLIYPNQKIRVR